MWFSKPGRRVFQTKRACSGATALHTKALSGLGSRLRVRVRVGLGWVGRVVELTTTVASEEVLSKVVLKMRTRAFYHEALLHGRYLPKVKGTLARIVPPAGAHGRLPCRLYSSRR